MINYAIYLFANPMISFGYVVLLRIQTLMFTPIQGISQGICIVTAHLTGAKRFKTLSQTLKKLIIIVMLVTAIVGVIYLFSYKSIIVYFTDNTEAKKAIGSLIVSILSLFSQPVVRITNYYFIGIGKSIYSLLSILLNVSMFVVFMLIGEVLFNSHEFGIFMAIVLLM